MDRIEAIKILLYGFILGILLGISMSKEPQKIDKTDKNISEQMGFMEFGEEKLTDTCLTELFMDGIC